MSQRREKGEGGRGGLERREAIAAMGLGALGVALPSWQDFLRARAAAPDDTFFTPSERALVTMLADMIIPRDERSGNVSDSGGIDYIDFVAGRGDEKTRATIRKELAWYDEECRRRFGREFVACTEAERGQLLDAIAWPAKALPEVQEGVTFFNRFRDLTASGFWSSQVGMQDLGYQGNTFVREWTGCPPEAKARIGAN